MSVAVICDVDGTLVDTNYLHALCWFRAFRQSDITVPIWRIHRTIGMGGDKLVTAAAGDEVEDQKGEEIRDAHGTLYMDVIEEVQAFEGARELLQVLAERDHAVVLASSAKEKEVDHYLDLLDARELIAGWTTSDDVEETKPEPELIEAALEKVGARDAVMIGDTVWDCEAAGRAGLPTITVLSGGFSRDELEGAGAAMVLDSVADLAAQPELVERVGAG
ncbi:MAG: HAD family hydrolase [Solirubrobacterales bacterium]